MTEKTLNNWELLNSLENKTKLNTLVKEKSKLKNYMEINNKENYHIQAYGHG